MLVDAVNLRDAGLAQGGIMMLAATFVAINLAVDVLYAYLDPRIRYDWPGTSPGIALQGSAEAHAAALPAPSSDRTSRSARQMLVRQFVRNRGAIGGLAIVGLFLVLTLVGPLLTPYDPLDQDLSSAFLPRSLSHPLGTDELGRDTLPGCCTAHESPC